MKERIRHYLELFREGFAHVLRVHPVEVLLATYACVGGVLTYELDWTRATEKLFLVPIFFVAALVIDTLAGRGPCRKVYWVCWLPIVPLSLWSGLREWLETSPACITFGILLPLALLLCRRAVRNGRFVFDAIVWLRSGVLAFFFANAVLGLFCVIFYSTIYIFALDGAWSTHVVVWASILCETLGVPVLFLMMSDRWAGAEFRGQRILEVLLNWIVTPALGIYAAILYLYMVKILVTWTLPRGGVAYLVFGFTIFVLAVRAFQTLLEKRIYDRIFDRASWFLLPTQVLFWVGAMRRTGEYGLTEPRIYLLVCGALMTLCVLAFLGRRTGRYYYVCGAAFVAFAALAYVPALEPGRVALRNQRMRFDRVARSLELLDAEGRLRTGLVPVSDTVRYAEYRELFASMAYVAAGDSTFLNSLGVGGQTTWRLRERMLPKEVLRRIHRAEYGIDDVEVVEVLPYESQVEIELPRNYRVEPTPEYPVLRADISHWGSDNEGVRFLNDTLRVTLDGERLLTIAGDDLVRIQMRRTGLTFDDLLSGDAEHTAPLLDYRDERLRILFNDLKVLRRDSLTYGLGGATVELIMTR